MALTPDDELYMVRAQLQAQNYANNQMYNQQSVAILGALQQGVGSYGTPLRTPDSEGPAAAQTGNRNLLVLLTDV